MLRPLLIPLTYFYLQTWLGISQAERQEELSMMKDAFDDQYIGCAEEMNRTARAQIDLEMSPFSPLWENARKKWNSVKITISPPPPPDFEDEYGIAIVAYTDHRPYNGKTFPTIFNDAVNGTERSQTASMANFQFRAFHYYLTRALQLLRGKCDETNKMELYRGTNYMYDGSGEIRFGRFASSSTKKEKAEEFGRTTVFTIRTCFGVKIQAMSYNPDQEEVLIPVHEIFKVTKKQGNNIILHSTNQACSYFNCGEKKQACAYNSATRGGPAFPSELSSSLFGGSIILVHVAALKLFAGF
nr:ecto-ADP-ribosyltransferase 5 [Chrysemys picta bellii]